MKADPAFYPCDAAAIVALSGLLLCAATASRSEDLPAVESPARVIVLPKMSAGGIPFGQVLQITERGGTLVAAAQSNREPAAPALTAAQALRLAKSPPGLFCAGTM